MADKRTREALIDEVAILKNEIARLHQLLQDYVRLEDERRLQLEAAKEAGKLRSMADRKEVIRNCREQFRRNGGSTL